MEDRGAIPKLTIENQRGTDHSFRAFSKAKEGHDYLLYYVKIPFFLIIAEIRKSDKYEWVNTELIVGNIILNIDEIEFPSIVNEIIDTIHRNKENSKKMMTSKQEEKLRISIENEMRKNPVKFNKSGSIQAMLKGKR
ncbi:hypothetical protein D3C76_1143570 [compost metagenome]